METYNKEEVIHEDFCEKGALSHVLGRSNVRAGTAGRRRQDMQGAGYWRRGTLCLGLLHCSLGVAPSSLPSSVNFGASANTNQVGPVSSCKADNSPAQRLAPASLDRVF